MKRGESGKILADIGLSEDQSARLLGAIEQCSFPRKGRSDPFSDGFEDAVNSMHRFIRGDLESHDEFEDDKSVPKDAEVEYLRVWPSFISSMARDVFLESLAPLAQASEAILSANQRATLVAALEDLYRPDMLFGPVRAKDIGSKEHYTIYRCFRWVTAALIIAVVAHGCAADLDREDNETK